MELKRRTFHNAYLSKVSFEKVRGEKKKNIQLFQEIPNLRRNFWIHALPGDGLEARSESGSNIAPE